MTHPDRIRWNEKYRTKGPAAFGREPSNWLLAQEKLLMEQPRGPALDLACGNGRNAIYLAKLGFSVDARDISDVAIAWLTEHKEATNLAISPIQQNLVNAQLLKAHYQVVINLNFLERSLFAAIRQALMPGGLLFFKAFVKPSGTGPTSLPNSRFTLDKDELLGAFADLQLVEYDEEVIFVEKQNAWRTMARLIARKE